MFETLFVLLTRLADSEDALWTVEDGLFDVTLEDFAGFDADWAEIDRPFADIEMVEALFELLAFAQREEDGWHVTYRFDDCSLVLRYASEDI